MPRSIIESPRRLALRQNYDVIVAGGGIAGVAAALASAREGATVALLEKEYGLGGLATLGNVTYFLYLCDGCGHMVARGLAESLLKLTRQDPTHTTAPGAVPIPPAWLRPASPVERAKERYLVGLNPATYAMQLEKLVLHRGIDLLYDTRVCAVHCRAGRIQAVIIEDKGGRAALGCRAVVDTTGDADVCHAVGESLDCCEVNVPCGWFYYVDHAGRAHLAHFTEPFDVNARIVPKQASAGFGLHNSRDATALQIASNRSMNRHLNKLRKSQNDPNLQILRPPSIPCYRNTRRLIGAYELSTADDRVFFPDTIGMIGHWRFRGPIYCIPFRSLYGKTPNLLAAGRCISTTREAWDITRVIACCAVTGEAAGAAAALLARQPKGSCHHLDVPALQRLLRRRRVLIDARLTRSRTIITDPNAPTAH